MFSSRSIFRSPVFVFILVVLVIGLMVIIRKTYVLETFRFNSDSNSPTIPPRHTVFTSILKKPKRFDFIAFRNNLQPGSPIWISRVCGMPGDTVEIRNGNLIVNGKEVDSQFTLSHSYLVYPKDTSGMNVSEHSQVPDAVDSVLITYPDQLIKKRHIYFERYITPPQITDAYIEKVFRQPWNLDNFGPVKVPVWSYFVLGDNRSNAMDSRYIGFIYQNDFKGTVLQ